MEGNRKVNETLEISDYVSCVNYLQRTYGLIYSYVSSTEYQGLVPGSLRIEEIYSSCIFRCILY